MNRFPKRLLAWAVIFMLASTTVDGAISVGPDGSGITTFDDLPGSSEWTTRTIEGSSGDIVGSTALDVSVQSLSAADINFSIAASTASPPPATSFAQWSSSGGYIQTRPTGAGALIIMAKLRNDTGSNITRVRIAYDFDLIQPMVEEVVGHQMYYSLTGLNGGWQAVRQVSVAGHLFVDIDLNLLWMDGGMLYLLWADDNGSGVPDGGCIIDNFTAVPISGVSGVPPSILSEPVDYALRIGNSLRFAVVVTGTEPLMFQWWQEDSPRIGATNTAFTLASVVATDAGGYRCIITNNFGSVTSRVAQLSVSFLQIRGFPGIVLTGTPGKTYRIEASAQVAGQWVILTNVSLPQSPYIWIDYDAPTIGSRVYRAAELP